MKKNTVTKRRMLSVILAVAMAFGLSINAFADWVPYNPGTNGTYANTTGAYLQETWIGGKQCINYYNAQGQWQRNIAGEGHTLWLNSQPIMYNLYNTGYWCFDQFGNAWIIDTAKQLYLLKAGSTELLKNTSVWSCTGFQRDAGKIGYLLYSDNGTFELNALLNGTSGNNYNNNNNNNYNYGSSDYLTQSGNVYYYHTSSQTYSYELKNKYAYCNGRQVASNVTEIGFAKGSFVYVNTSKQVYRTSIGSTSKGSLVGSNFKYFIYDNDSWITSMYNGSRNISITSSSSRYDYDNDYDDDDEYPYVEKKSGYYYYYRSSGRYYKYSMSGSTLYYRGTTSSSSTSRTIASSVDEITFTDGYIVYATTSGYVYAMPIGETDTSERIQIGTKFEYFDEEDDYWSNGYYTTADRYVDFEDELDYDDDDDDYYDDDYPYAKKSGSYYYYYRSSGRYYKYLMSGSTLYYKGTNNSSSTSRTIASSVDEITFTDGYIVYATTSGYVYAMPIGETDTSERIQIGTRFEYFDEEDDYWSNGYYTTADRYVDFEDELD